MKSKGKSLKKRIAVVCVLLVIFGGLFTADLLRAKRYSLPPLFCICGMDYENGSREYYGLGYKVWEDYHPFDKTTKYYVGFWFIPKFCRI